MGLFKRITIPNVGDVEIYEPTGLTTSRRTKICFFAHGQNSDMFAGVVNSMYGEGLPYHLKFGGFDPDCVVIMPYGTTNNGWNNYNGFWNRLYNWAIANYNVHPGHVVFASYSLGGINAAKEIVYTDSVIRNAITHWVMISGFPSSGEYDAMFSYTPKSNQYLVAGANDTVLNPNSDARGYESYLNGKLRNNIKYTLVSGGDHFSVPATLKWWEDGLVFSGIMRVNKRVPIATKKSKYGLVGAPNDFYNIQSSDANGQLFAGWAARFPYISKLSLYLTRNLFLFRSENGGYVATNSFGINRMIFLIRQANPNIIIEFRLMGLDYKELVTYPENLRRGDYNMVEAPYQANRDLPASYDGFAKDMKLLYEQVVQGKESYVWLKDGNEPDIGQGFVPNRDYMSPVQSSARHRQLQVVVKSAYPGVKISSPGFYSGPSYITPYCQQFVNNGWPFPDRWAIHNYPVNYTVNKWQDPDSGLFRQVIVDAAGAIRAFVSNAEIHLDEYGSDSQNATTSNKQVPYELWRGYKTSRMLEIACEEGFAGTSVYAAIDEDPVGGSGGNDTYSGEVDANNNNKSAWTERMAVFNEMDATPPPNQPPATNAGNDQTKQIPTGQTSTFVDLAGTVTDTDGTVTSTVWSLLSGPNVPTFATPNSVNTRVSNLVTGQYIFRLTGTDNQNSSSFDDVVVTILAPNVPNNPPVADAGVDISITLPTNSVALSGTDSDNDGTVVSREWSLVSGPNTPVITKANTANATASNLIAGTYVFRYRVTDDDNDSASDTKTVVVNPAPNQPPVTNAGSDQTKQIAQGQTTTFVDLSGSVSDTDGSVASVLWDQVSGPNNATIETPAAVNTRVSGLIAGEYVFRLTGKDNQNATSSDTVKVVISPADNILPVANAGTDKTIKLPTNTVNLDGSGSDADGSISSYFWQKVSGSGSISSPNSASTTVTGFTAGVSVFRLTVTDNRGGQSSDEVTVTTQAANMPPIVNAGGNKTITLPTNSVILSGSATDGDGSISSYKWIRLSGPGSPTISDPNQAQVTVSNLMVGTHVFELQVKDNENATGSDTATVVVNPPANQAPSIVTAGTISITLPTNEVELDAIITDDKGINNSFWEMVEGPGPVVIENPLLAKTKATGLVQGKYVFKISATDTDQATSAALLTVMVNPAGTLPPKYRITFYDDDNRQWQIDFATEGYDGEIITLLGVDSQAFVKSYASDVDNPRAPLFISQADISFYKNQFFDIADFQEAQDKEFVVSAYVDGELDWRGFALAEGVEDTLADSATGAPAVIRIQARDGLSMLENMPYTHNNLPGFTSSGRRCPINYFRQILFSPNNLGLPLPIRWSVDLENLAFPGEDVFSESVTWGAGGEAFSSYQVVDEGSSPVEYKTCEYILKGMLKSMQCRLFQANGKWVIRRIQNLHTGILQYKENPADLGVFQIESGEEDINETLGTGGFEFLGDPPILTVVPGIKSAKVTYEANVRENLLPNGNLDLTYLGYPLYWGLTENAAFLSQDISLNGRSGSSVKLTNPSGAAVAQFALVIPPEPDGNFVAGLPVDSYKLFKRFTFGFTFVPKLGFTYNSETGFIDWSNNPLQITVLYFIGDKIYHLNEFGFWVEPFTTINPTVEALKINDVAQISFNRNNSVIVPKPEEELTPGMKSEIKILFTLKPGQEYILDDIYFNSEKNNDVYESAVADATKNTKKEEDTLEISSSFGGYMLSNFMSTWYKSDEEFFFKDGDMYEGSLTGLTANAMMRSMYKSMTVFNGSVSTRKKKWSFDQVYNIQTLNNKKFIQSRAVFDAQNCKVSLTVIESRNDAIPLIEKHYGSNDSQLSN